MSASNLVASLRRAADGQYRAPDVMNLCEEAADEIDRLRAELSDREVKFLTVHTQRDRYWQENHRLRAALKSIMERGDTDDSAKHMYWIASNALSDPPAPESSQDEGNIWKYQDPSL